MSKDSCWPPQSLIWFYGLLCVLAVVSCSGGLYAGWKGLIRTWGRQAKVRQELDELSWMIRAAYLRGEYRCRLRNGEEVNIYGASMFTL